MSKNLKTIIIIALLIWIVIIVVDYRRVLHSFEKPLFAQLDVSEAKSDGGSGTYRGLGYFFVIDGNFMPEDEFPGVKKANFYFLGREIKKSIRD